MSGHEGGYETMATVVLDKVNKVYDNGYHAIHDLSLDIEDGEFLVLVGPSGCGKSTALRMIAGLETISGGEMRIGERVVNDIEPKDRDIAMVFQNYALYPHMTVYDNIGFALKLAKVPKEEIDKRVRRAAETLELTTYLDRKPGQLSGGQRQRVAMGRAIVRQPAAFLMDEPLSNLDAKLRVQMRAEIAHLQRELGVTTFYVTHDQVEAMTMGDRVAVIKDGYLQQVDTPQNLYDRPANVFVAAFIGSPSMNLYDAMLHVQGDGGSIKLGSQTLTLSPELLAKRPGLRNYDGKRVVFGIRPEDFEDVAIAGEVAEGSSLKADVSLLEALGSEIMVHFSIDAGRVDSGDPDAVEEAAGTANAVGRFSPRSRVRAGDTANVAVTIENLHFFDNDTRLAIWELTRHDDGSRGGARGAPPRRVQERGGAVVRRSMRRISAFWRSSGTSVPASRSIMVRGSAGAVLGDVLVDRRELHEPRHVVIVHAHEREVVGHRDASVTSCPQRTEGHLVGEREHRSGRVGAVEQRVERLVAALDREVAGHVQRRVGDEPGLAVRQLVALLPLVGHDEAEHVVGLAVDHADPPVTEIEEVLRRQPADLDVVDAEARDGVVVVADVDDLHPLVLEPADLVVGERDVDADEPVDSAVDRPGDLEHVAALALGADADDDGVVARLGEDGLDAGHDVREVPAVEQGHGHGDRPASGRRRGETQPDRLGSSARPRSSRSAPGWVRRRSAGRAVPG